MRYFTEVEQQDADRAQRGNACACPIAQSFHRTWEGLRTICVGGPLYGVDVVMIDGRKGTFYLRPGGVRRLWAWDAGGEFQLGEIEIVGEFDESTIPHDPICV